MKPLNRCLLLAAICTWITPTGHAADWPQFRGPDGQGVASDEGLPVTWSDNENLLWKTDMPGAGSSSPIVLDGKVYLTCYSGYGTGGGAGNMEALALHVVCVDAETGGIAWDRQVKAKLPESRKVRDHGYAGPTPATDGKHLYVFFGKSGVLKFDLNGKQLWQTDVGSTLHSWGCGTSPVLFKNLVVVNASVESGSLVALDKGSGKEVWRNGGMKASWNTPHLVTAPGGARELVVSVKDRLLAFDPATGKALWNCEGIHDYVCPSVVSHQGVVYAIGGRKSQAVAVRAGGREDVTSSHRLWVANAGANVSSPVVHDGHLYWVSDRNQTAYCLRLNDGGVVYSQKFPGQPYASVVLADGKLYVVTRRGGTVVLAATPEYKQLAHNKLDDGSTFNASPAIAASRLFLRSDRRLYCIGKGN